MAEMIDSVIDEQSELDAVEQQIEQQKPSIESVPVEEELPEQYRGMSAASIAKRHREAEQALSRQGQELGEVRKLADELLKAQLIKKAEAKAEESEVDFFDNPQEAINRAVAKNPQVVAAEHYMQQARMDAAKQQLINKHPDFVQVVQDPEFVSWVNSSPTRARLYQEAEGYNVDSADELFSTYKQLKNVKQAQTFAVDTKVRDRAMQAASVDTGGSGESSQKIYKSRDLIRLKIQDPNRYYAMEDEILAAYQTGRVR